MAGAAAPYRWVDFITRWLFVFALLLGVYNPTGYCYVAWLLVPDSEFVPVKIFIGLTVALLLWFIYGMAMRSMKRWGVILGVAFFASAAWALENQGLLPRSLPVWIVLIQAGVAAWLAAGLAVTPLRQYVSGHVTAVDEVH